MAKFLSQFYVTQDELIDFVKDVLDMHGVFATAVHRPFRTETISNDNVSRVVSQPSVWCVVFTAFPPALLSLATCGQLLDNNEGSLVLDIGRLVDGSLVESSLGTMTASPVWKKINTFLKSRTKAGGIGTHEKTGASAFYRDHRHTAGARALSEQGTALRQDAKSPIVFRPGVKPLKQ